MFGLTAFRDNGCAHRLIATSYFNAASNRSRAERGEGFVTRDLFEASGIPIDRDHLFRRTATTHSGRVKRHPELPPLRHEELPPR
jgi:hypothetical protein